jgi:hypothetical protein
MSGDEVWHPQNGTGERCWSWGGSDPTPYRNLPQPDYGTLVECGMCHRLGVQVHKGRTADAIRALYPGTSVEQDGETITITFGRPSS